MNISTSILTWFDIAKRDLPFRNNKNPYNIWVSEIMLQQTKVETVIPYYNNWIKKYPDIVSVAKAPESNLLKTWEGLGYYARCRNFHKAAKIVCKDYDSISLALGISLEVYQLSVIILQELFFLSHLISHLLL